MKNDYYLPQGVRIRSGHVYLISPVKTRKGWADGIGKHPFKIGVSKSTDGVNNRLRDLSAGNWLTLDVDYVSPEILHPFNVELFLHWNYSKNKIRGEWFNLSYSEYEYITDWLDKEPDADFDTLRGRGAQIREYGYFVI